MNPKRLLLIDDEKPILDVLSISLASDGYEVVTAQSGQEGVEIFEQGGIKLVITDIRMPGMDGVEVLRRVKQRDPEAEVIVITGHGDMESAIAVLREGASDFITKPIKEEALSLALKRAERKLEMARLIKEYTIGLEEKIQEYKKELDAAQEELLKKERLAIIGETVAGLAHYIKNILNALKGGSFKVESGLAKGDQGLLLDGWVMVQRNLDRISQLALDLLDFSKERVPERTTCSPADLIGEAMAVLLPKAEGKGVKLEAQLKEVGDVQWDRKGIHRALLNLGENAIDACGPLPGIQRDFRVVFRLDLTHDPQGQEKIVIEVIDNGCGMSEEVKQKVFSRFFSTKGGQGTGLGLLLTKKIIEEHGGQISFESQLGEGTTFRIVLPPKASTPCFRG